MIPNLCFKNISISSISFNWRKVVNFNSVIIHLNGLSFKLPNELKLSLLYHNNENYNTNDHNYINEDDKIG